MLFVVTLFIAMLIVIGVYVYHDAAKRGMNSVMWTLIAVLGPLCSGVIIYLFLRSSYPDEMKAKLSTIRKDTVSGKFIFVTLVLLLLLAPLGVYCLGIVDYAASSAIKNCYLEDFKENAEIIEWIDECNEEPSRVYALRYRMDEYRTNFLIYIPVIGEMDSFDIRTPHLLHGGNLVIKIEEDSDRLDTNIKYKLVSVNFSSSKKFAGLKVFVNGKSADCEIIEINYAPVSHYWGN
jgi:hypothetical protein